MARNSLKSVCRLIQATQQESPVEVDFLEDLKRSIELSNIKNSRKPSETYKPSSMNCIRGMYYQVTGAEVEESTSSYALVGICNSGTDIHQRVQQSVIDMKSNDIDCEYINVADYVRSRNLDYLEIVKEPDFEHGDYETKLYHKTLNISFLCDGIIRYKGKYYILELKTESTYKWNSRQGVDPSHFNQGTSYSLAFGIDNVIFVYINRDVLSMKSYLFTPTEDMKSTIIATINTCDEYVASGIVPPIPEDVSKKACEYCNYKNQCRLDS